MCIISGKQSTEFLAKMCYRIYSNTLELVNSIETNTVYGKTWVAISNNDVWDSETLSLWVRKLDFAVQRSVYNELFLNFLANKSMQYTMISASINEILKKEADELVYMITAIIEKYGIKYVIADTTLISCILKVGANKNNCVTIITSASMMTLLAFACKECILITGQSSLRRCCVAVEISLAKRVYDLEAKSYICTYKQNSNQLINKEGNIYNKLLVVLTNSWIKKKYFTMYDILNGMQQCILCLFERNNKKSYNCISHNIAIKFYLISVSMALMEIPVAAADDSLWKNHQYNFQFVGAFGLFGGFGVKNMYSECVTDESRCVETLVLSPGRQMFGLYNAAQCVYPVSLFGDNNMTSEKFFGYDLGELGTYTSFVNKVTLAVQNGTFIRIMYKYMNELSGYRINNRVNVTQPSVMNQKQVKLIDVVDTTKKVQEDKKHILAKWESWFILILTFLQYGAVYCVSALVHDYIMMVVLSISIISNITLTISLYAVEPVWDLLKNNNYHEKGIIACNDQSSYIIYDGDDKIFRKHVIEKTVLRKNALWWNISCICSLINSFSFLVLVPSATNFAQGVMLGALILGSLYRLKPRSIKSDKQRRDAKVGKMHIKGVILLDRTALVVELATMKVEKKYIVGKVVPDAPQWELLCDFVNSESMSEQEKIRFYSEPPEYMRTSLIKYFVVHNGKLKRLTNSALKEL